MRTIAVVNQKGGCGKTITAINLAAFLARARRRVLVVDMDPQGHATLGLVAGSVQHAATVSDLFLTKARREIVRLRDIICVAHQNLDLIPADILMSAVPEMLAGVPEREDILAEALTQVGHDYDYIIVDCPPNVGLLTFNALKACSEAIVPMDPSFFSLHGIGKLFETFDVLGNDAGHTITPRVLVTLYMGRSPFVKAVLDEIHDHLAGRCFETLIRYSVKLAEAASHGVPIASYCRHCAGFEDYQALANEIVRQEEGTATRVATDATDDADTLQALLRRRIADSLEPQLRTTYDLPQSRTPGATEPRAADARTTVRAALVEFDEEQERLR